MTWLISVEQVEERACYYDIIYLYKASVGEEHYNEVGVWLNLKRKTYFYFINPCPAE